MPTNLTGSTINSTYDQLLHIDGGPVASEQTVYSGTGVASSGATITGLPFAANSLVGSTGGLGAQTPADSAVVRIFNGSSSISAIPARTLTGQYWQLSATYTV